MMDKTELECPVCHYNESTYMFMGTDAEVNQMGKALKIKPEEVWELNTCPSCGSSWNKKSKKVVHFGPTTAEEISVYPLEGPGFFDVARRKLGTEPGPERED